MSVHVIDALCGFLGGAIPGGVHLAWTFTRNNRIVSGNIDLTVKAPARKKLK